MSYPHDLNIGAYVKGMRGFANTAVTAGGSGDNTLITGVAVDRSLADYPRSCVVSVSYTTTLAQAATMTFKTAKIETDDDVAFGTATDLVTLESSTGTVIETGGTGGSTNTGCKDYDVDLSAAKRYIRVKLTPDLSASGTDTAALACVVTLGPGAQLPE